MINIHSKLPNAAVPQGIEAHGPFIINSDHRLKGVGLNIIFKEGNP